MDAALNSDWRTASQAMVPDSNRILEDGRNRQYYRASACSGERRFPDKKFQ